MSRVTSTIDGQNHQVQIDDERGSAGRSALGRSLQALADSGRGIDVGLPGGQTVTISNAQVRELERSGGHRDQQLATMLQAHGVSAGNALGIARRVLGGADGLVHEPLRHNSGSDPDNVSIAIIGAETRIVAPTTAPAESVTPPRTGARPTGQRDEISMRTLNTRANQLFEATGAFERAAGHPGQSANVRVSINGQEHALTAEQTGRAQQILLLHVAALDPTSPLQDRQGAVNDSLQFFSQLLGGEENARHFLSGRGRIIVEENQIH